jgi:hypothetical protein
LRNREQLQGVDAFGSLEWQQDAHLAAVGLDPTEVLILLDRAGGKARLGQGHLLRLHAEPELVAIHVVAVRDAILHFQLAWGGDACGQLERLFGATGLRRQPHGTSQPSMHRRVA